jgi:hypothetical protein
VISFDHRSNIVGTVSTWMNYHLKGTHRTVESRSQELVSTDEADCNAFVKQAHVIVMLTTMHICSGLRDALVKNCNATELQVPINK